MSLLVHSLNKCGQDVTIEDRDTSIINGQVSEVFTNPRIVKAIVKTVNGVTTFDDTNTERVVTHKLTIAYIASITAESWVKLGTKRIKILSVINCAEKDKALTLMCTERGEDSKVVNSA